MSKYVPNMNYYYITIQTFKKRQRALKDIDKCEIVLFLSIQNNSKPMMVIFFGIFLNKKNYQFKDR